MAENINPKIQAAHDLAYRLAKLGNARPIPCSEGYGPVWELYRELKAAIWALAPAGVGVVDDTTDHAAMTSTTAKE